MSPSAQLDIEGGRRRTNGHNGGRALVPGVYVPTVVFFDANTEALDLKALSRHSVRLARAGVTGIAVQGSNGEAVHLTHDERQRIIQTTRTALDDAGFTSMPVLVGCGAQSTREAIDLCEQAHEYGGDYALVLPPNYYRGLFNASTIAEYFTAVADASPIPLIIYNYPQATGVDLTSDALITLGNHPNIIGCKFTCGNTGKLGRVASAFSSGAKTGSFLCFAGSVDFFLPSLITGSAGVIGGLANISPKAVVRLLELYQQGRDEEANALHDVLGRADWAAIQTGVVGTKVAMEEFFGYGGWARKPLPRPEGLERAKIIDGFREIVELEKTL